MESRWVPKRCWKRSASCKKENEYLKRQREIPGKKSHEHTGGGTAQRYAMIELSVQFPVQDCCVALNVSHSGYYQWLGAEESARAEADAELLKEIRRVYDEHKGRYGSPRVTQQIRQEGLACGENRVARLVRENGLAARAKKAFRPRTTTPGHRPGETRGSREILQGNAPVHGVYGIQ